MRKLLLALFLLAPIFAGALTPTARPDDMPEDLYVRNQVENFFKNVKTMQADFTQVDGQGKVSGGKFFLKRPNKFRWEYDSRQPLLIISNGENLVYRDNELDETTHVRAENTLATFLSREEVRLEGDITLHDAFLDNDFMKVRISITDKPDDGQIALYFAKKDMSLLRMDVIDSAGYSTKIQFAKQVYDAPLANSHFIYKDPKFDKNVWEKK